MNYRFEFSAKYHVSSAAGQDSIQLFNLSSMPFAFAPGLPFLLSFLIFYLVQTSLLTVLVESHPSSHCQTPHLSMGGLSRKKNFSRQSMASRVPHEPILMIYAVRQTNFEGGLAGKGLPQKQLQVSTSKTKMQNTDFHSTSCF